MLETFLKTPVEASPPAAVYPDLVASLFTMRLPIVGFGFLYVFVAALIFLRWPDPFILGLILSAIAVTIARVMVLNGYDRAGGPSQSIAYLYQWERWYACGVWGFAALLALLNVRVLMVHEPLMHTGTVSLVFVFGAGVVSRTSCRPLVCITGLLIAVVPTATAMLVHAAGPNDQPLHRAFFVLFALLLLTVLTMSLDSVRHLYAATLEKLITKHDLAKLARLDALTGLPNRLMLRDAFGARLNSAGQTYVAIHYLDLDGFKAINDKFGHPAGDKLLKTVAARLLATVRSQDVVARLGGDEFLLIQSKVRHRDEAELLARRVIKLLSDPYIIDGAAMKVSVSVGIALAPDHGTEFDELTTFADTALYASKAQGKSQLQFYAADDTNNEARSAAQHKIGRHSDRHTQASSWDI